MGTTELERIIKTKLAAIDAFNRSTKGEHKATRLYHELRGIKHACYAMGIKVTFDGNPYFYEDSKPSTFTIEELKQEVTQKWKSTQYIHSSMTMEK